MLAEPLEWQQFFDDGPRPRLARLAFFLATAATGVGGAYLVLVFASMQISNPALRRWVDDPRWDHFLGAPTAVASLLAALLLTGLRSEKAWRARTTLLLTVSAVWLELWCVEHSHFFGWTNRPHSGGDDPLKILCLRSIALIRVVTLADLAVAAVDLQGSRGVTALRACAVRAAAFAFVLWLVLALTHIDVNQRPPQWRDIRDPISFNLLAGSILLRGLSGVLAAILCANAFSLTSPQRRTEGGPDRFTFGERPRIG
jgi:hypothetical protein